MQNPSHIKNFKAKLLNVKCYLLNDKCYLLNTRNGFTLVELLVVIGVIALVMVVLFPNLNGARQRARDAQRKSDLSQMQKALELYKLDQNPPVYPADTSSFPTCGSCWSNDGSCNSGSTIYMRRFPCDPGGLAPTYAYTRNSDMTYTITACLENKGDPDRDNPTACASTGVSYTVHEP